MPDAGTYDIGMVGLGVMGRNLLLNIADHGFSGVGLDTDEAKVTALAVEGRGKPLLGVRTPEELATALKKPRAVMLLVPAGRPVDAVIDELTPLFEPGDLIIDAGNSHFIDTDRRVSALTRKGLHFVGMGVSGGEYGARHGPSMMPGGDRDAYERIRPILESIAARAGDVICVDYMGPGSAGHYVKMVHNGIEYGLIQMIAESYDILSRGLGLSDDELATIYQQWNAGPIAGFLIEITSEIFQKVDEVTGGRLVDHILDEAKQRGTGKWTAQSALDLQVPSPTIDAAVSLRDMSGLKSERENASKILSGPAVGQGGHEWVGRLENALQACMVATLAQGMCLLQAASKAYGYELRMESIARIWQGGCIIRAAMLTDVEAAFVRRPDLVNLMLDPAFSRRLQENIPDLRSVIAFAIERGLPVAAHSASLAYYDSYRSGWLPANLIQAQRDYFGSHTYERIDAKGPVHTDWSAGA
jgi:6-phosphogluconate dehydrogenase